MRIDWQALEIAFDSAGPEVQAWLDLRTGEVLLCYAMEDVAERADFADRVAADPDRYAEVQAPGSSELWRWMAEFAESLRDERLRDLLEVALRGTGAFHRFQEILHIHAPEQRERWHAIRDARMREAIERWVAGLDLEVENAPPRPGASVPPTEATSDVPDCPFCRPDRAPVVETALARALPDALPASPGHTFVVPCRHVATYLDCTHAEQRAIWEMVGDVCARLEAERRPSGFDIAIAAADAANETVAHCHIDVTPRFQGHARSRPGGIHKTLPPRAA